MKRWSRVTLPLMILCLSACAVKLEDYQNTEPALDLSEFFNGHLEAYGVVQDYKGKVTRRFRADILGSWQGNEGVLDELFFFADGEQQHRCWRLSKNGNEYRGRAGDVVGEAVGMTAGNALNWRYVLAIPVDDKVWNIKLDDWMFLVDENNLINRASLSKFGFEVGQITLYIRKVSPQPHRPLSSDCELSES